MPSVLLRVDDLHPDNVALNVLVEVDEGLPIEHSLCAGNLFTLPDVEV